MWENGRAGGCSGSWAHDFLLRESIRYQGKIVYDYTLKQLTVTIGEGEGDITSFVHPSTHSLADLCVHTYVCVLLQSKLRALHH